MDTPSACLRVVALLPAPEDHAQKKTAHAAEQERPDILKKREERFDGPSTSILISLSSSTRHGRRPIWRVLAGVRPAVSGCAPPSRTATGRRRPSSPACARRASRSHPAPHVGRRDRVQLVEQGGYCLINITKPQGSRDAAGKRRPCRDGGGGEIVRLFASSQPERPRLQH